MSGDNIDRNKYLCIHTQSFTAHFYGVKHLDLNVEHLSKHNHLVGRGTGYTCTPVLTCTPVEFLPGSDNVDVDVWHPPLIYTGVWGWPGGGGG